MTGRPKERFKPTLPKKSEVDGVIESHLGIVMLSFQSNATHVTCRGHPWPLFQSNYSSFHLLLSLFFYLDRGTCYPMERGLSSDRIDRQMSTHLTLSTFHLSFVRRIIF